MSLRHQLLQPRRVIALAFGFAFAVAGEPIRFSKPAQPVAAPAAPQTELPEPRTRGLGFSTPNIEAPVVQPPQQQVIRVAPREEKKDNQHWLLNEPKMFSDPDRDSEKSPSGNSRNTRATSPWSNDRLGMQKPDSIHALAPETDFNWRPDSANKNQKDVRGNNLDRNDRNDSRGHNMFGSREDANVSGESLRPTSFSDIFTSRTKEKPSAAQLALRAEFEQLLNPNANPATRGPNSLDPVIGADDVAKRPASIGIPTINGRPLEPKASDPMTAFNQQHDRLRGPTLESFDKKYGSSPAAAPISPLDPRYKSPLNQQPTVHSFPERRF